MPSKKTAPVKRSGVRAQRHSNLSRLHGQTLIEMNTSVFTARRDAAHERVLTVLRRDMQTSNKELRVKLYRFCAELLEEAAQCTRRSQVQADSPVLHYINLLRGTLASSQALLEHEMRLVREKTEFSRMLNEQVLSQLQTANDVFSNSEMNILDCIDEMLKFGEPILAQDSQERLKAFSDDDRRRYETAVAEYRRVHEKRLAGVRSHSGQPG